jgi:hypothetical protein
MERRIEKLCSLCNRSSEGKTNHIPVCYGICFTQLHKDRRKKSLIHHTHFSNEISMQFGEKRLFCLRGGGTYMEIPLSST